MNIIRRIFGKSSDELSETTKKDTNSDEISSSANINSNHSSDQKEEKAEPTHGVLDDNGLSSDTPKSESNVIEGEANNPDIVTKPTMAAGTRPLETEAVAHQQHISLTFGKASDVGMVRENNQDACLAMQLVSNTVDDRPDFGFFVVADGMGGHHDGEKASTICVDTVTSQMLENIYIPMLNKIDDSDRPTIVEAMVSAAEKSNLEVIKNVPDGGTTLTSVAVVGNLAYVAHVGDSRAYLINNGEMEQLTRDHSLVQRLIELNQLKPEEAEVHPQKNVLYRAIGQNENLEVERLIRPLPEGAQMMICSDGLWGLIDNNKMRDIILEAPTPQDACDKLVALANSQGGTDNITVIILKIPSSK